MKTLTERINAIEAQISKERECMAAILADNAVTIREELHDEDEQMCYDTAHKTVVDLQNALARIGSILNSTEQYMLAYCG